MKTGKVESMTWDEFLSNCNVSHWVFYEGGEGYISKMDPACGSDFLMLSPIKIVYGGGVVTISDGIGESYIILTKNPNAGNGEEKEYSPLHGRIFASRKEAETYLHETGEKKNNESGIA